MTIKRKITTLVLTTALALSTAAGAASASPQSPETPVQTQCSAGQDSQFTAEQRDKPADVAPEQKQSAIEKSKEKLRNADNANKLDFEHANVMATQAGAQKLWTTVAQERKENSNEDYIFYRVAVDLEKGEVASVQRFEMTPREQETFDVKMYVDDELFWTGTTNSSGTLETQADSPTTEQELHQEGFCEWFVGALCGTGGGAGCYGICAALALTTGWGGLGCAAVCALIASLGCVGATKAICG